MKIRSTILAAIPVLCALQLAGCGEPPQPVDAPRAPTPAAGPDAARVTGTILFEGAGFEAPTGFLYVSIHPKGNPIPMYSRQYPLQGVVLEKDAAGVRSLKFDVGMKNFIGSGATNEAPPVACDLVVKYKEQLDVASKTLAEAKADYQAGKSDYVLTLKLP